MKNRSKTILPSAALSLLLAGSTAGFVMPAIAQESYPERPVTLVVPFPPGGSTDILARNIADAISGPLGQPVVVENRGGAGGTVGAYHVVNSAPDGYTLLMGVTGSNALSAALRDDLPYDPVTDFDAVSIVVSSPLALVVHADSEFETTQDVIDFAAANPEGFAHGTPGVGTAMHMTAELFGLESGTTLLHVPYAGSAAALQDLLGGQLDAMFADILVVSEYVQAGRLRALAVTGTEEHFLLEGVPTVAESGIEGFSSVSWQGVFAPSGTPPEILDRLYEEIVLALESEELVESFAERGFLLEVMPPAESQAFIAEQVETWIGVVEAIGLEIEE